MALYSLHIPGMKESLKSMGNPEGCAELIAAYAQKNTYYSSADTPRTAFCSIINHLLPKEEKPTAKMLNDIYFSKAPGNVPDFMKVVENGGLSD